MTGKHWEGIAGVKNRKSKTTRMSLLLLSVAVQKHSSYLPTVVRADHAAARARCIFSFQGSKLYIESRFEMGSTPQLPECN